MGREGHRLATLELDKRKVLECDAFLLVLDGRVSDEGACVDLGLAHAHRELQRERRPIVGPRTDPRVAFLGSELNPMLRVPLEIVAKDEEALLAVLEGYLATRRVP